MEPEGAPKMSINVMVVDDHQLFREGIRNMLEREDDLKFLGEAADGRSAVRLARELGPDVIVMDVCMPDMNGIVATSLIIAEFPKIKVLALSMSCDRRFVLKMLQAGASGYLLKHCSFRELAGAIRSVAANKTYLSQEITDIVVKDYVLYPVYSDSPPSFSLTLREREVLQLVAEGKSTAQIADTLHVSAKTIESHRQNLMGKLNIKNIAGLTKFAIREGLTFA